MMYKPLASKMRPQTLKSFIGQSHLLSEGRPLQLAVQNGRLHSFILWGGPGIGKTTLAFLITKEWGCHFAHLSAVSVGVKEIREVIQSASDSKEPTVLFLDEIHALKKNQQDVLLPAVEDGKILVVGATTENPSFNVNNAMLSRCRVYRLNPLSVDDLCSVALSALSDRQNGYGLSKIAIKSSALRRLASLSQGDARRCLNNLEAVVDALDDDECEIIDEHLYVLSDSNIASLGKMGDDYYDQLSALHKSIRGSDADAALVWTASLLKGGCDYRIVARRLLAIASEDVSLADPKALEQVVAAWQVYERVGPAEGERALAQAVVYLSLSPKSNALYVAWKKACAMVDESVKTVVPMHLRNAPTQLLADIGCGDGYRYAHDEPGGYAPGVNFFPEGWEAEGIYSPSDRGRERYFSQYINYLRQRDLDYEMEI